MVMVAPFFAFKVNLPSKSVIAPVEVPLACIVAPIRGVSVSSTMTPFKVNS